LPVHETVLFLPGAFTDRRLFAHQLEHLGDVAAPGFVDLPDVDTVDVMAERILADAPARFALAGLSLGGVVAFEILRRAPERVTRLALMATTPEPDPPPVTAIRRAAIDRVRGGDFEGQVNTVVPVLLGPETRGRPDHVTAVRGMVTAVGPDRYARQIEALVARPDQRALAAAVARPTLVLGGRDDPVTTVEAQRALADTIPTARLAVVEQAGHLVTLDQPVAVTALLRDWLAYAG
jgi:pimeloyl-ACP methyl ester carboxylesterase